jgi:hypothetical protein
MARTLEWKIAGGVGGDNWSEGGSKGRWSKFFGGLIAGSGRQPRTLEHHKGCGTQAYFRASISAIRNSTNLFTTPLNFQEGKKLPPLQEPTPQRWATQNCGKGRPPAVEITSKFGGENREYVKEWHGAGSTPSKFSNMIDNRLHGRGIRQKLASTHPVQLFLPIQRQHSI